LCLCKTSTLDRRPTQAVGLAWVGVCEHKMLYKVIL